MADEYAGFEKNERYRKSLRLSVVAAIQEIGAKQESVNS